MVIQGT